MITEELNRRLCDVCQMEDLDCIDCDHKTGRRESDICGSHKQLEKEQKDNNAFKLQMKAGIAVGAFFLLTFMIGISSSNRIAAQDMADKQDKFEKSAKMLQTEHKREVTSELLSIKEQTNEMVELVRNIKSSVDVLVGSHKIDRERDDEDRRKAAAERSYNREQIEKLLRQTK